MLHHTHDEAVILGWLFVELVSDYVSAREVHSRLSFKLFHVIINFIREKLRGEIFIGEQSKNLVDAWLRGYYRDPGSNSAGMKKAKAWPANADEREHGKVENVCRHNFFGGLLRWKRAVNSEHFCVFQESVHFCWFVGSRMVRHISALAASTKRPRLVNTRRESSHPRDGCRSGRSIRVVSRP
jgi:hypothetical protein